MKADKKNNLILDFKSLTRQNTGIHPMDSGGTCGRQWQQPLPPSSSYFEVDRYGKQVELRAYIPLHTFLDSKLKINTELTSNLAEAGLVNYGTGDNEVIEFIEKATGLKYRGMEYTYNQETDLTQDFQYTVFSLTENWYEDDDVLLLVETHNGADARGGFSQLVACNPMNGSLSDCYFFGMECEVIPLDGVDNNGCEIDRETLLEEFQEFQIGYQSNPMYHFAELVEDVLNITEDRAEVTVKLKDGRKVKVYVSDRLEY
jgi:hypothetical protein